MDDDKKLPVERSLLPGPLTSPPALEAKSRRALFRMTTHMIGGAIHSGPTRALLEPALKALTEAESYEAGLNQFHKEAMSAFADAIDPVAKGPGGDFLANPDLSRTTSEVVSSIRDTVDSMSESIQYYAKGDGKLLAVNGRVRVHLDLLHLELLFAIQRLATDQQSVTARHAFLEALGAFLEQAKRSFLAD